MGQIQYITCCNKFMMADFNGFGVWYCFSSVSDLHQSWTFPTKFSTSYLPAILALFLANKLDIFNYLERFLIYSCFQK
ncbi:hypothetical protein X975_05902, partial [Stegodyphus mimosarum]